MTRKLFVVETTTPFRQLSDRDVTDDVIEVGDVSGEIVPDRRFKCGSLRCGQSVKRQHTD